MTLHADFDSMAEVAGFLRSKQEEITNLLNELNDKVVDLTQGAFVTPEASQAYADAADGFVQNNITNIDNIESFAAWLESSADTLQGTDSDLAGSVTA